MLITGEGLLNLKNAFGAGETIGLTWQRLRRLPKDLASTITSLTCFIRR